MSYTDDPARDWDNHCAEQEQQMAKLPVCENPKCQKRIDDHYFCIEGEILCEDCVIFFYRKDVDDFD